MTATTNHRRWLITGVSSGLGRALAEHVLDHGDTVIATMGHADLAAEFEQLRTNFASSSLRSVRRSLPEDAESVAAVKHRYAAAAELMPNDPRRRISGYANDRSWTTATAFETAKAR